MEKLSSADLSRMPMKKLEAESAALQARQRGPYVVATAVPVNSSLCATKFDCASCQEAASGGGSNCLWCHHPKGTSKTKAHFYCGSTCNTGDTNAGCSADD